MPNMIVCKCVDVGSTLTLQVNKDYYCYPNGPNHYYVSRFPNPGAHFGCFRKDYFQETTESLEPPKIDTAFLNRDSIYQAELIFRKKYNSVKLHDYYIRPRKTHCFFYKDLELTRLQGSFPLHWFTNFREIMPYEPPPVEEVVVEEEPIIQDEQLSLF